MTVERIVSVSGGKDSTAVYCLAVERGKPFRAIFLDTGNEHPATYAYIDRLPELAGGPPIERYAADFTRRLETRKKNIDAEWRKEKINQNGKTLPPLPAEKIAAAKEVLAPTGNRFWDLCLAMGRFPSPVARFCTSELKVKVFEDQVLKPALESGAHVLNFLGERRDESAARSRKETMSRMRWRNGARHIIVRPIFDWTAPDVFRYLRRRGVAPNPLYARGAQRVGCNPCIMARHKEIALLLRDQPGRVDEIAGIEAKMNIACRGGQASYFQADVAGPAGVAALAAGKSLGIREALEYADAHAGQTDLELGDDLGCDSGFCE